MIDNESDKMPSKNLFPLTQYLYKLVIITKIVHCTTRRNKIGVVAIQLDSDFDPVNAFVDGNSSFQWLFWLIGYEYPVPGFYGV